MKKVIVIFFTLSTLILIENNLKCGDELDRALQEHPLVRPRRHAREETAPITASPAVDPDEALRKLAAESGHRGVGVITDPLGESLLARKRRMQANRAKGKKPGEMD
ncbi:hypothetical protein HN446_04835 [bacterium]|jgi:hypothetical protein|nr:hypothetical protein [bacterium]